MPSLEGLVSQEEKGEEGGRDKKEGEKEEIGERRKKKE